MTAIAPTHTFRPIPGFDGYEVSDHGAVRSYRCQNGGRRPVPRLLKLQVNSGGYWSVHLMQGGRCRTLVVHRLLMLAFVGPRPSGLETRHLNGDPLDCRLENLAYGTASENCLDRERHHPREACKRGHPFDETNAYVAPNGERGCRVCRRTAQAAYRARQSA